MSRHARYTLPDIPQYIMQRGNNGEHIFLEDKDYLYFKDCLQDASIQYDCKIHAYAFLHNQVHLLITQQASHGIAQLFQSLGRRYVRYFNDLHGRSGTLWEGRYKSCLVQPEQYLMSCYRYIDLHPVRNGMVKNPEEYNWSSAAAYIRGVTDRLVNEHSVYSAFVGESNERQQKYKKFLSQGVPKKEAELIKKTVDKSGVLGSESFMFEMEKLLGRRLRPRKPGRPRQCEGKKLIMSPGY